VKQILPADTESTWPVAPVAELQLARTHPASTHNTVTKTATTATGESRLRCAPGCDMDDLSTAQACTGRQDLLGENSQFVEIVRGA
jgi:hypothetical protein